MGLFGSSIKTALRLQDVTGALDLQRERAGAKALGMRVVGVRVVRESKRPVDGERIARTIDTPPRGVQANLLFKRASPSPPAWSKRPGEFSAYPREWELGLLRFDAAFQREAARQHTMLVALRLAVPKQTGRYLIEPVDVGAWMTYLGQFRFSSLDITPPAFETFPNVTVASNAEPSPAASLDRIRAGAHSGDAGFAQTGVEASPAGMEVGEACPDPYAFYRLMNEGRFVYHLYEDGLDADFDEYWLRKYSTLANRGFPRLEEPGGSLSIRSPKEMD